MSHAPVSDYLEVIHWHWADKPLRPDAMLTVELQVVEHDGSLVNEKGYWDGEHWIYCESGGQAPARAVRAWAMVSGPPADPDATAQLKADHEPA